MLVRSLIVDDCIEASAPFSCVMHHRLLIRCCLLVVLSLVLTALSMDGIGRAERWTVG